MSDNLKELGWTDGSRMRIHGTTGHKIIALHGGPAAVGSIAPIASTLADEFTVYEPWQRGSSDIPLTVERHVEDLHSLIVQIEYGENPVILGESWGAMLALAYSAAYPASTGPLVLVGCGTFDMQSRARMKEIIEERTTDEMRNNLRQLQQTNVDPDTLLKKKYDLIRSIYDYDPIHSSDDDDTGESFDMKAHIETWNDMLRCQKDGLYPESFNAIVSPVMMLHGSYDPHPGDMTRDTLLTYIPHLEYREFEKCGHSPWNERHAVASFFRVMRQWLNDNL